jgi:hypothetical protein
MKIREQDLDKNVALIESAANRAAAGFRSMLPAATSIRQRAPDVSERLLPALLGLRKAIDELIATVTEERKA